MIIVLKKTVDCTTVARIQLDENNYQIPLRENCMSEDIFLIGEDKTSSYVAFTLANSCMPTLVKQKPSSLVGFRKRYIDSRDNFFKALIKECEGFDCCFRVLCEGKDELYIIIYNQVLLNEILQQNRENPLFFENGYLIESCSLDAAIELLEDRYSRYQRNKTLGLEKGFPHEIGIFLGYPAGDVTEYIRNNGENYILCGYWKVYHNAEEAQRIFDLFTFIRRTAVGLFFAGRPLAEIRYSLQMN